MIDQHTAVAVLRPLNLLLEDKSIDFTLDEAWSPYGQGTIVCQMPSPEDREDIDIRATPLRLDMQLRRDFGSRWTLADIDLLGGNDLAVLDALLDGGPLATIENLLHVPWNPAGLIPSQAREFALYVTEREFDDVTKELTLTVATGEALLEGDVLGADEPLDPASTSVVAIVNSVLARYDARLEPDSLDAVVAEVDATLWRPGDTAAEYLDNLLEPASLRLWCDELGRWRTSTRQATVDGAIVLTPSNMTAHRDRMSADPKVWADFVLVRNRWTDEFDLNREEIDYAGAQPSTSPLVVERTTVYPGPGAAAGILNRMQGRGRVLDIEADSVYTAVPGISVTVTPPETPALTGYVSAITWRLPAGEMRVETRGLVDTPETSWLFVEPGISWNDVPVGMSWLEYDPEDL